MALKDRLNDALQATPAENTARQGTLRAVLAASGDGSDAEIQAALARLISEREQKAASYSAAGQSDLARAERAEIDALRGLLRLATPEPKPAPTSTPKKQNAPTPAAAPSAPAPAISRNQLLIGGVALVVLAVIVFFLVRPSGTGNEGQTAAGTTQVTLRTDDRTLGNPKAPIVMLEYAAPSCPHCARFASTVMPQIKEEYIDKGKVFYVFRTFPINPSDGAVEGIARLCLPADKYFQFLDLMFRNQPKWDPEYQIPDVGGAIKQMARIMGITPDQADRCMTDPKEQERINQVSLEAQNRYGIHGTPTFVINGTVVTTSEATWPQLKTRFDSILSKK